MPPAVRHAEPRAPGAWAFWTLSAVAATFVALLPASADAGRKGCRLRNMTSINGQFCIDRYEAVTQAKVNGRWRDQPHYESVQGKETRALSRPGRYPQAYISRNEAEAACKGSGKRLCTEQEWKTACKGKQPTLYPYGKTHTPGRCNDSGVSPLNHYYGTRNGPPVSAYGWGPMNDPKLNQLRGTLARTGSFSRCRNSWGLYDMVGNLHEWVDDPGGRFLGGYYLDTKINGEGCDYKTVAHNASYHDYSTGFRCCAELR